jgi:hypothetical protein
MLLMLKLALALILRLRRDAARSAARQPRRRTSQQKAQAQSPQHAPYQSQPMLMLSQHGLQATGAIDSCMATMQATQEQSLAESSV